MMRFRRESRSTYTQEDGPRQEPFSCPCCGARTEALHGFVYRDGDAHAVYYAGWSPSHSPAFISMVVAVGEWIEGTTTSDREGLAYHLVPTVGASGFEAVSIRPEESPWAQSALYGDLHEHGGIARSVKSEIERLVAEIPVMDVRLSQAMQGAWFVA